MSINNSTRAVAQVSVTSAVLGLPDSQYKRRIGQVEEKNYSYQKDEQKIQSLSKKARQNSTNSFSSAAQEIYTTVSGTFNELVNLTSHRLNPVAFANLNAAPSSSFNNVDLKRHQNYFNQMMNFDTPVGSWIDIKT